MLLDGVNDVTEQDFCVHTTLQLVLINRRCHSTHLNGKAQYLNAHPAHIRGCHVPHQFGKLVPIPIDLLHGQGP